MKTSLLNFLCREWLREIAAYRDTVERAPSQKGYSCRVAAKFCRGAGTQATHPNSKLLLGVWELGV